MMGGGEHLALILVEVQHIAQIAGHARAIGAVLGGELFNQQVLLECDGRRGLVVALVVVVIVVQGADGGCYQVGAIDGGGVGHGLIADLHALSRLHALADMVDRRLLHTAYLRLDSEALHLARGVVVHLGRHVQLARLGIIDTHGGREGEVVFGQVVTGHHGLHAQTAVFVAVIPFSGSVLVEIAGIACGAAHHGDGARGAALLVAEADEELIPGGDVDGNVEHHAVPSLGDARLVARRDDTLGEVLARGCGAHPYLERVDVDAGAESHSHAHNLVVDKGAQRDRCEADGTRDPFLALGGSPALGRNLSFAVAQREGVCLGSRWKRGQQYG